MGTRPSWRHQLLAGALLPASGVKRANTEAGLDAQLAGRRPEAGPSRRASRGLTITRDTHDGCSVWQLTPSRTPSGATVLLALHGGAYVLGVSEFHHALYGELARRTGATVIVPLYPLAPDGQASEVVASTTSLLAELMRQHGADHVAMLGDSAGGGLALAAAQAVSGGVRELHSLTLISPWLDATVSDPRSADINDPMLDIGWLRACGRLWSGPLSADDPRVSPLFGDLSGLPPTTVHSGTRDLLYPDALRLTELARDAGVHVTLDLKPGLIHDWPLFGFVPEARATITEIASRLSEPR